MIMVTRSSMGSNALSNTLHWLLLFNAIDWLNVWLNLTLIIVKCVIHWLFNDYWIVRKNLLHFAKLPVGIGVWISPGHSKSFSKDVLKRVVFYSQVMD